MLPRPWYGLGPLSVATTGNASAKATSASSARGVQRTKSRSGPGVEEADPDPEKAGQQDEVRGVVHEDVVRADPADQGEFHQQHEEAGEDGPGRAGGLSRALAVARSLDGSGGFPGRRLSSIHPPHRNNRSGG